MTGYPAERMRLRNIGRVAERYAADLVVLDPATVDAGPTAADGAPPGIETVILSGEIAAAHGRVVPGGRHGRIVRRS